MRNRPDHNPEAPGRARPRKAHPKSWVLGSVLIAVLTLGTAACGGGGSSTAQGKPSASATQGRPGSGKGYVIGFSNSFCANSWRKEMLAGLQLAIKKDEQAGTVKKFIHSCANGDTTKQISDINSMIAQHVNALLVIPNSGTALNLVVSRATASRIVTSPFNLPLQGGNYTPFSGTNPCRKATLDATWLAQQVKGKPGGIVGLGGTPGNSYTAEGWACATKIFNKDHVNVLTLRYANWEVAQAKSVMASLIAAYPKISGIWSDGSQNALGAEQALAAAGRPLVPATGDDYNGLMKYWVTQHKQHPN